MKIVFCLPNLRRAEGVAGVMPGYVAQLVPGTDSRMYLDDKSGETPWPGTLTLVVSDESFSIVVGKKLTNTFYSTATKRVETPRTLFYPSHLSRNVSYVLV